MRSVSEISFRIRQESANLYLWSTVPTLRSECPNQLPVPEAERISQAFSKHRYKDNLLGIASGIMAGKMPLFGGHVDVGRQIRWRFDYRHERDSALSYFRRIRYLDFTAVGDHKFIWELNRHQHLVLLAQAYCLNGDEGYLREIESQLESWHAQNPFQRGINWASALEVAFRVFSWVWLSHLVGTKLKPSARTALVSGIYQHGLHLAANLSIYFSPNTHLLGEAVALYTIALAFPTMPNAARWLVESRTIVEEQLRFQVRDDGSHFEQSTYYHVYALDFFLWFYLLAGRPQNFRSTLTKMADYLYWLLGRSGRIWFFGDDDGGRLFHPYGERAAFGRATLATAGLLFDRPEWLGDELDLAEQACWWIGPEVLALAQSKRTLPSGGRCFPDSGAVFLQDAASFLQFDGGPFGYGGAGHSHSDSLSLCLNRHGKDELIDPGTFTYIRDPQDRNWFRGSKAHNTLVINGQDQADPVTPFRWDRKPEVKLSGWRQTSDAGFVDATCRYRGLSHRRRLALEADRILVLDEVNGAGDAELEQFWHWAEGPRTLEISSTDRTTRAAGRISPAYGTATEAEITVVRTTASRQRAVATIIAPEACDVTVEAARARLDNLATS